MTLSGTATASGASASITDSPFITGYELGCQSDVSAGLLVGGTLAFGPSWRWACPWRTRRAYRQGTENSP